MRVIPVRSRTLALAACALLASAALAACGSDDTTSSAGSPTSAGPQVTSKTVTLITYDSFALSKATLADFEKKTGIKVKVLKNGDAGKIVNTAILTKNRPQGDVLWGVDNTFLSKALDAGIFESYASPALVDVPEEYQLDKEQHRVTPVDHGEVCLNYDKAWFAKQKLAPPTSFEDLADPDYKDLLVVENPATSSPGLSFLLATVAKYGDGWQDYWNSLRNNGVKAVAGWDQAYYTEFTAGGDKGKRPIVVSYASSPAAVVDFAEEKLTEAPTAVVESTCFSSIEFAGVLAGAKHADAARVLIDYLIGPEVQKDIPPNMYVYPVRNGTPLPESFTKYAAVIDEPLTLDVATIGANRETWTREWQKIVLP